MKPALKKPPKTSLTIGLLIDDSLDCQDGVQRYLLTLASWLSDQGHSVHYLAGNSTRQDLRQLHSLARVIRVNFNGNKVGTPLPVGRGRLKRLIQKHDFDVVHVQSPHSPLFAGRLIKELPTRTAVVSSLHVLPSGPLAELGLRLLGRWSRTSLERVDRFIANSEPTADFFKRHWKIASTLIANPIDLGQFTNPKNHPSYRPDKLNLVFMGRLVKRKGILNLIEALALLPQTCQDKIYVHLGGSGQLMDKAQARLDYHKLNPIAKLYGRIEDSDKTSFLAMADIAIFPSSGGESFGISVAEGMAATKGAVLAGRNPGYSSVLAHNDDFLCDAQDPKDIANSLRRWILSSNKQRHLASIWLRDLVASYDIDGSVGPQILAVYQQVLASKN